MGDTSRTAHTRGSSCFQPDTTPHHTTHSSYDSRLAEVKAKALETKKRLAVTQAEAKAKREADKAAKKQQEEDEAEESDDDDDDIDDLVFDWRTKGV